MILVSVIVPVYNVEQYLARCIESLLIQTYKNIEIILIDDGSPDKCGEICDWYSEKDERIKVIHKNNGGLSDARNAGLDSASGDYVTFIDSDDFVADIFIEYLLSLCLKNRVSIAQCGIERGNKNFFSEEQVRKQYRIVIWNTEDLMAAPGRKFDNTAWGKLYLRALFEDIRFPVGKLQEDEYVTYKVAFKSQRLAVSNAHLYYYYMSPNSIMRSKHVNDKFYVDGKEAYYQRVKYFKDLKKNKLADIQRKELCLRIIIEYCEVSADKEKKIETRNCYSEFQTVFSNIKCKAYVSFRERLILSFFRIFPTIFAWIENQLHIRQHLKFSREKK